MIKTIGICAKCCDLCGIAFLDEEGKQIGEYDGYVPDFMPDNDYGDYIALDIEVETGQIVNWKVTKKQVDEFFKTKATPVDLSDYEQKTA